MERARLALCHLGEIWDELPEEWVYSDLDNLDTPLYTLEYYKRFLGDQLDDPEEFWKGLTS